VAELSAVSEQGFEDAINQAVARATKTLRGVEGCWVKDMNVLIDDGNIVGYKVNVAITFVLEDTAHSDEAVPSTTGQDAPLSPGQEPPY
jgi:dodecin